MNTTKTPIEQCFLKIIELANKYLYDRDIKKAYEIALEIKAHGGMIHDLLKAKGGKNGA